MIKIRSVTLLSVILWVWFHPRWGFAVAMTATVSTSTTSTPIPPPPPISLPVWSLAAATTTNTGAALATTSMNIVTYAIAVSIVPKLFVVSLYHDTMTKDAFLESKYGILQLLTPEQHGLVHILGKHSGYEAAATGYSKPMECAKIGCDWVPCRFGCGEEEQNNNDSSATFHPPPHILPNCALYLVLKVQSTMPAGDHELALCQVTHTCRMDTTTGRLVAVDPQMAALDETNVLYTRQLRQMGIL